MARRSRTGQSTLEYVLLVTAVIVVIIWLVASGTDSPFRKTLNSSLNSSFSSMSNMGDRLQKVIK